MKKTVKTWMFAALLLATSSATFAQDNNSPRGNRPSREQMVERRANNIAKQLGLDAKTSKKFLSVYKKEQSDMMEQMPHRGGMPPRGERPQGMPPQGERPQGNPPAMNGKPVGSPQMSADDKKKVDSIKQKYNKKYAKFLSRDQISKMYQIQEQERQKNRPNGTNRHQNPSK